MPGVVSVAPRVQGGLLSQVLQGVQIARDVYGIKHESDQQDLADQENARKQQSFDEEQAGELPAASKVAVMRFGSSVPAEVPGSIPLKFHGDTTPTNFLPYKAQDAGPVGTWIQTQDKNGNPMQQYVNAQIGDSYPLPVKQTAAKEPKLMTVQEPNEDGDMVTKVVPMVAGATYAPKSTGKKKDPEDIYADIGSKFETARGNKAFQQASVNLLNIGSFEKDLEPYKDNLDKLPQKLATLAYADLEKIATGGSGTEGGREALAANTFKTALNKFTSQFDGEPPAGDVGAFIKDYADYIQGLKASNQSAQDKHYKLVWDTNKNKLPAELQQRMQDENPDYFRWKATGAGPAAVAYSAHGQPGQPSGTATAAEERAKPDAALHPDASAYAAAAQEVVNNPKNYSPDKVKKAEMVLQRIKATMPRSQPAVDVSGDGPVDRPSTTQGGM